VPKYPTQPTPPPGQRSIAQDISLQQARVLRGQETRRFDKIRQRHFWSTYNFDPTPNSGAVDPATFLVKPGDYSVFTTASGKPGQGLPTGYQLTDADTNFAGEKRVGDDQNFSIWELGVTVMGPRQDVASGFAASVVQAGALLPVDADSILDQGVLMLKYLTNDVSLGLLSTFSQPGGPSINAPSLLSSKAPHGAIVGPPDFATAGLGPSPLISTVQNSGNIPAAPALRRKFKVPIFLAATETFEFIIRFPRPVQITGATQGGTGAFRLRIDWWAVETYRTRN